MSSKTSLDKIELRFLKGVGEKMSQKLEKADITSVWDLLLFMPRKYLDHRKPMSFSEIDLASRTSSLVFSEGVVESYHDRRMGRGRRVSEALIRISSSSLGAYVYFVWFQPQQKDFIERRYPPGSKVTFSGKAQSFRGRVQISHPELYDTEKTEEQPWHRGAFVPVYKEVSGISTRVLRKILYHALKVDELKTLKNTLPKNDLNLPTLLDSIREMHFPEKVEPHPDYGLWGSPYFQRLAFEEFFFMSLSLLHQRHLWMKSVESEVKLPWVSRAKEFIEEKSKTLPFKLTGDQIKSLEDIASDLNPSGFAIPMHRLVQGDVGAGKTIVAFLAMLACEKEGLQSSLMAPTEILADQHYHNFLKLFPEYSEKVVLLKGSLTAKEKTEARKKIASGEVLMVIGTQALIAAKTKFHKLGLIVVDEQHRFGVEQRIEMKKKSDGEIIPHLLVMTATPIPRSLAMSLYGDLDISIIREKPPGRKPIKTHLLNMTQMDGLKKRVAELVAEGKQAYVVYPLVEESEELDLKDVTSAFEEWKAVLGEEKVALLHGKMKVKEKDAAMAAFKAGEKKVLISTTVIEVGVDVPQASVMVIVHAERFGLSQLHQLRGRVGRGAEESICVLVGPKSINATIQERLQTMVDSDDGFYVAEKDLQIRGPGEFLGTRQSGVPAFRVAQIIRDLKILEQARGLAEKIIENDPGLSSPESAPLRDGIDLWWSSRLYVNQSG